MSTPMIGNLVMDYAGALGVIIGTENDFYYVEWLKNNLTSFAAEAEIEEMTNRYKKYRMENNL